MFTLGFDIGNGQNSFCDQHKSCRWIVLAFKQDKYECNMISTSPVLIILLYKGHSNLGENVRIYLFTIHVHVIAINWMNKWMHWVMSHKLYNHTTVRSFKGD